MIGHQINLNIYEEKNVAETINFYQNYDLSSLLDDRFTFDNFVVGAPNEFAYAAARSVAESSVTEAKTNFISTQMIEDVSTIRNT